MPKATLNNLQDMDLSAFVLSSSANRAIVPDKILGLSLDFMDSDDPRSLRFATLFNIINGVAFGASMGMPPWVMLDCVLLPSMFIGIKGPARWISPERRHQIDVALDLYLHAGETPLDGVLKMAGIADISGKLEDDEIIPLAEFCALPTYDHTRVVGMSLYNVCSGAGDQAINGLGRISKALGLAVYRRCGARTQIGVTQYDNPALRTHTCFGPLNLLHALTPLHTKANRTFIYSLTIPEEDVLANIARGEPLDDPTPSNVEILRPDGSPRLFEIDSRIRAGTHGYRIVAPGYDRALSGATLIEEILSS